MSELRETVLTIFDNIRDLRDAYDILFEAYEQASESDEFEIAKHVNSACDYLVLTVGLALVPPDPFHPECTFCQTMLITRGSPHDPSPECEWGRIGTHCLCKECTKDLLLYKPKTEPRIKAGMKPVPGIPAEVYRASFQNNKFVVMKQLISGQEVLLEVAPADKQFYDRSGEIQPFAWGYGGTGPKNLSRAILWDYFADDPKQVERTNSLWLPFLYQQLVDRDRTSSWTLTRRTITKWLSGESAQETAARI